MSFPSYIRELLIRTNAKHWSNTNSIAILSDLKYNLKKNYIEDLILSGRFWGGVSAEKYVTNDIVVSLTTYGKRLNYVHLAIASIMLQTKRANRIILWLGEEQKDVILPEMLKRLQQFGLEIYYTRDIRSFTKLIPALRVCPYDTIITIDDDLIYDVCLLEHLINAHLLNPCCIYGTRCHKIVLNENNVASYNDWDMEINNPVESFLVLPTGVGGVLYPPKSLDEEVFNEDVFLSICPTTDDIWFKAMSLKKRFMTGKSFSTNISGQDYLINTTLDKEGLNCLNLRHNINGINMQKLISKYNLLF